LNFVSFGHFGRSWRDIFFWSRTCLFKLTERIVGLLLMMILLWLLTHVFRVRIRIVSFECFQQLELCFFVLFLQLQLQFLYLKLSFSLFDLCVFCLSLYTLDFLLKHLALVIDLVSHLLDLVGEHLQFFVASEFLWIALSLLLEKLARYLGVKAATLSVL
jgi:hypothetical protein